MMCVSYVERVIYIYIYIYILYTRIHTHIYIYALDKFYGSKC